MRSEQQSERFRRIKALHDYLKDHMYEASPQQTIRLIHEISAVFPVNSHSYFLAEIVAEQINLLWNDGRLDRILLFTLALLLVFDRYISTVSLKRVFIDKVRTMDMKRKYSSPSNYNQAL